MTVSIHTAMRHTTQRERASPPSPKVGFAAPAPFTVKAQRVRTDFMANGSPPAGGGCTQISKAQCPSQEEERGEKLRGRHVGWLVWGGVSPHPRQGLPGGGQLAPVGFAQAPSTHGVMPWPTRWEAAVGARARVPWSEPPWTPEQLPHRHTHMSRMHDCHCSAARREGPVWEHCHSAIHCTLRMATHRNRGQGLWRRAEPRPFEPDHHGRYRRGSPAWDTPCALVHLHTGLVALGGLGSDLTPQRAQPFTPKPGIGSVTLHRPWTMSPYGEAVRPSQRGSSATIWARSPDRERPPVWEVRDITGLMRDAHPVPSDGARL